MNDLSQGLVEGADQAVRASLIRSNERSLNRMKDEPRRDTYIWDASPFESDPEMTELIDKVERALGFRLFYWQKTYIKYGCFRHCGKTLAEILNELLNVDAEPLDFTKGGMTAYRRWYMVRLCEIKEKLDAAGIPTRVVYFPYNNMNREQELKDRIAQLERQIDILVTRLNATTKTKED